MSAAALALCAEKVAAGDPDRFTAVMAAPAAARGALFALYAANLEIARAPWASSEPMVAEMRLQWWIDAFAAGATKGAEPPHEIGPALATLPAAALLALAEAAEARRADCWSDPFETVEALWDYLGATSGTLYATAGSLLGASDAGLRAYGQAAGLAQWLQALPELRARGRLDLAGADPAKLADLARKGLARLAAAKRAVKSRAARCAALPAFAAEAVLHNAASAPERIAEGRLRGSEFSRRFRLLRATLGL